MEATPLLQIPYPSENDNPFFGGFVTMINDVDAKLLAAREDRNLVLFSGGTFTWSASTSTLSWSGNLSIFSPLTGYVLYVPAGSIVVQSGQLFGVSLTRLPAGSQALAMAVSQFVPSQPNGDNQLLIGYRSGSILYFRNGRTMVDGDSFALFDTSTNVGGAASGSIQTLVSTSTYTVLSSDSYLILSAPSGGTTITSAIAPALGKFLHFKDDAGNAASNNTTINFAPHTLDGASAYTISTAHGWLTIRGNGTQWNRF
jgi:hypothetical protein